MKKIILSIDGMTCSACSNGLEKYLSLFKFFITDVPETTETSCSVDIPPKITPIFNLFIKSHPFKNQFLLIVF